MPHVEYRSFDFKDNPLRLLRLFKDERHVFLLESSQFHPQRGRYTFLGYDPFLIFQLSGPTALDQLKETFMPFRFRPASDLTPLAGGVVGCLAYDYGLYAQKIKRVAVDDLHLPDCYFGFYDRILTIDHLKKKLHITSTGLPETAPMLRRKKARMRLSEMVNKLAGLENDLREKTGENIATGSQALGLSPLVCSFTKADYLKAVDRALDYITRGDIYQVNLSQRFQYALPEDETHAVDIYGLLRGLSPSSFAGYLDAGPFQLLSSSPERFLFCHGRYAETRPMKGTRPRGRSGAEDQRFRREILESAKEKAELLMITDLERNDLGRVCEYGSIQVREMRTLEAYKTVYQTTASVSGTLKCDKDCFDLLQAAFPGGSITGCPKIRAMQIIEELEPTRRSFYTGCLGYINFAGNMDFNILIRTLLKKQAEIFYQVGGGIVADSLPENEYQETLVKAQALRACLEKLFCQKPRVVA